MPWKASKYLPFDFEPTFRAKLRAAQEAGESSRDGAIAYVQGIRVRWDGMSDEERELRMLIILLYRGEHTACFYDDLARDLLVTVFPGAYGPAGYVLVLDGSPPKGLLLVKTTGSAMAHEERIADAEMTFHGSGRPQVLARHGSSVKDREFRRIVADFLRVWQRNHPSDRRVGRKMDGQ